MTGPPPLAVRTVFDMANAIHAPITTRHLSILFNERDRETCGSRMGQWELPQDHDLILCTSMMADTFGCCHILFTYMV